ncbi:MAG: serine hydrolase [Gemmatimonadetes bacterium]|nr:serine hydrolase [Gemmatimonadota bacterium]
MDANTLFQAASTSKPVAASGIVAAGGGGSSRSTPRSRLPQGWKLPENRSPRKEKVTLRRIASHNAGLTVHGFPGYAATDSVHGAAAAGRHQAGNTAAVRVDTFPGASPRYSGRHPPSSSSS